MRILLVHPDYLIEGVGFRLAAMPEPLNLEIVAALVPDCDVRILDMRIDRDLSRALSEFGPDLVAVTALTTEVYAARDVVRDVKAHDASIATVVGGHHVTLIPDDFRMPEVDYICLGEAELGFGGLIEALRGKRPIEEVPNLIRRNGGNWTRTERLGSKIDMDAMPIPRRDLTEAYRSEYFFLFDKPDTSITTSHGCPFRCNFCSVWQFFQGKTCQMSARRVIEELKTVTTRHVTFVDDNFLMNHRRESEIADRIKAEGLELSYSMECRTDSIVRHPELVEKWVDIGLYAVLLGLEGAGDEMLKTVDKNNDARTNDEALRILRDNGVILWGAFIVDPDWEVDDFKRLREYVNRNEITHTQFTILTPLPGTVLHEQRKADLITDDYRCFDTLHCVLPTRLPRDEFYRQYANLYRQTDLSPYYDLVRNGKLTIDNCRQGKAMLDAMSDWRQLAKDDPIIGPEIREQLRADGDYAPEPKKRRRRANPSATDAKHPAD